MVNKEDINRIIEQIIKDNKLSLKCSHTVGEMHTILDSMHSNVKEYLLKSSLTEKQYNEYQQLEDEDEIFNMERKIFDNYKPSEINKILKNKFLENINFDNLNDKQARLVLLFDKKDYPHDDTKYSLMQEYPPGKMEQAQLDWEWKKHRNFVEEIDDAVYMWTHGGYRSIQEIRLGSFDEAGNEFLSGLDYVERCKSANKYLERGIKSSKGLVADNMLYRVGHWDIGLKNGDISEFPCFSSASYSAGAANSLGEGYAMHIYAPNGTKGMMIDTDYFHSDNFPEHEFLLGPGQKFIVLNVNDEDETAEILLL